MGIVEAMVTLFVFGIQVAFWICVIGVVLWILGALIDA